MEWENMNTKLFIEVQLIDSKQILLDKTWVLLMIFKLNLAWWPLPSHILTSLWRVAVFNYHKQKHTVAPAEPNQTDPEVRTARSLLKHQALVRFPWNLNLLCRICWWLFVWGQWRNIREVVQVTHSQQRCKTFSVNYQILTWLSCRKLGDSVIY